MTEDPILLIKADFAWQDVWLHSIDWSERERFWSDNTGKYPATGKGSNAVWACIFADRAQAAAGASAGVLLSESAIPLVPSPCQDFRALPKNPGAYQPAEYGYP